jgi:hypothetical protein
MTNKIKCGESEHCEHCKFYSIFINNEFGARFSKNNLGRCDWFADKKGSSRHILKIIT